MDITTLFCKIDDFLIENEKFISVNKLEEDKDRKRKYSSRKTMMSNSEVMTICILFHQYGYRNFKSFYMNYVCKHLNKDFPNLLSYNRFVELKKYNMENLSYFLQDNFEKSDGIAFIDSTPIQVCKPKRMSRNKVFKNVASKGKSTIGWFYGFKLHLIVNDKGGIVSVKLTKANTDDRTHVEKMTTGMFGKLFGDKGYISKDLTEKLKEQGIQLITGIKKNMKNKFMHVIDKILLRKRSIIETINDQLKNISQIEHSRHRSIHNFIVNILAGLIAYTLQDKKPSINLQQNFNKFVMIT